MNDLTHLNSVDHEVHQQLKDRAYRLLARREHSTHELRQKLTRYDSHGHLTDVLSALTAEGSLSDLRFARALGRSRVLSGKGPRILEQALRSHRLREDIVQSVMTDYQDLWLDLAADVRRKKFGDAVPDSFEVWAKQARFLQQRGFTTEQIGTYAGP